MYRQVVIVVISADVAKVLGMRLVPSGFIEVEAGFVDADGAMEVALEVD